MEPRETSRCFFNRYIRCLIRRSVYQQHMMIKFIISMEIWSFIALKHGFTFSRGRVQLFVNGTIKLITTYVEKRRARIGFTLYRYKSILARVELMEIPIDVPSRLWRFLLFFSPETIRCSWQRTGARIRGTSEYLKRTNLVCGGGRSAKRPAMLPSNRIANKIGCYSPARWNGEEKY